MDAIRRRAEQLVRSWGSKAPSVAAAHLEQARGRGDTAQIMRWEKIKLAVEALLRGDP